MKNTKFSIIFPVHNEKGNLVELISRTNNTLKKFYKKNENEIMCIDDGSTDGSPELLNKLKKKHNSLSVIIKPEREGHPKALETGFKNVKSSEIIMIMDADLQYNPEDIQKFIEKINEGYDVVNGRRTNRIEKLSKRLPSKIYNWLMRTMFDIPFYDFASTFTAYRSEFVKNLILCDGDQRYLIAVAVCSKGAKNLIEVPIIQNRRKYGISKYGSWKKWVGGFPQLLLAWFRIKFTRFY